MSISQYIKKCGPYFQKLIAQTLNSIERKNRVESNRVDGQNLKITLIKSGQQKGPTAKKGRIKSGKFQTGGGSNLELLVEKLGGHPFWGPKCASLVIQAGVRTQDQRQQEQQYPFAF